MSNLVVNRYELKYKISNQQYHLLAPLLSSVLDIDENAKDNNTYFIRSLYFDSGDDLDYYAKTDGLYERKKIRLRLYDLHQDFIKLEVKNKYGGTMRKETAFISRIDAQALCQGDLECLLAYEGPAIGNIYRGLKVNGAAPVVIVDYDREAYVCKAQNIRINFDKNIRACSTNLNLFDPNIATIPLSDGETMVLEVKYTHYLPDFIRNILASCLLNKTSYSKYCIARETV